MRFALPPELEPFRLQLEQASKPFVKLSRHPDATIDLTHSKLGGLPYLPYSLEYSTDDNHIFIRPEALRQQKFSCVRYYLCP